MTPTPWLTHGEWVMSVLTLIYVAFTGVYVVISRKTLKEIEKQAERAEVESVARDKQFAEQLKVSRDAASAASLNAQAVIEAERARVDILFHRITPALHELRLTNFGKSYAIITKHVLIHAYLTQKEFDELPKRMDAREEWGAREATNTYSILPADDKSVPAVILEITNFLREELEGITTLFGARVEYNDIFDESHETEVVYVVRYDPLTKSPMLVHIPGLTLYT